MVGIVIVSHSLKAAEGIREIAVEMGKPGQPIAATGGCDDGCLGIDLDKVERAIEAVDEGHGVILFVDLGSAIICADMIKNRRKLHEKEICIADAPVLEGAVIAAVEASLGSSMEKILEVAAKVKDISKIQKIN
ncbi:dihydroxyacetone kinase phosphoryl donor subunit DhaM [Pectinatus haikarae]|uniref:phosphoenolpyruvate--glycerone phosphotransferase n=1 Tax=Pectinatus haikarae TaxID=349096 RepID=A0ABT9Y966_9FIRM|nr:dihydroxyacetone kinase phosphoryl donor subunit DhaM [Pectinatus haikarae]MDQ0204347.1 dihydroxyacetone kinase phosphotransfer subunit [Pectinatus haikarae]